MPGHADHGPLLERLGQHKRGRAWLDITRLSDIDTGVLVQLIRAGRADRGNRWSVTAD
jgi:hypothetical protein